MSNPSGATGRECAGSSEQHAQVPLSSEARGSPPSTALLLQGSDGRTAMTCVLHHVFLLLLQSFAYIDRRSELMGSLRSRGVIVISAIV